MLSGHYIIALSSLSLFFQPPVWFWVFYLTTALSMGAALHCILATTFLSIWGPGLALRGGTGSVSRAYKEMKRERGHIVFSFNFCIVTFALQCVATFYTYTSTCNPDFPCYRNGKIVPPNNSTSKKTLQDDLSDGWLLPNISAFIMSVGALITLRFIVRMKARMSRRS